MTLGEQLAEVQSALSSARKSIITKSGDKEVQRSYKMLIEEKKQLLKMIDTHGTNYVEGQSTTPKSAVYGVSFG